MSTSAGWDSEGAVASDVSAVAVDDVEPDTPLALVGDAGSGGILVSDTGTDCDNGDGCVHVVELTDVGG